MLLLLLYGLVGLLLTVLLQACFGSIAYPAKLVTILFWPLLFVGFLSLGFFMLLIMLFHSIIECLSGFSPDTERDKNEPS